MFSSLSQFLVAASRRRRTENQQGPCVSHSLQPHAALTVSGVRIHIWSTHVCPRISLCRQIARYHSAYDSTSSTACGGDLPPLVIKRYRTKCVLRTTIRCLLLLLVTNVYNSFQKGHHVVRRSDQYWSELLTDIIIVDVLMGEVLRFNGGGADKRQGYE